MFINAIKILKLKKIFNHPKKTDILVLDSIFFEEIKSTFKNYKNISISCLKIRLEEINLLILLKNFFTFKKNNFFNYMASYIKAVNPKIVITGNDGFLNFYNLKDLFPEIYFISIQNGYRNWVFFKELKQEKNAKADLVFVHNKHLCRLYEKNLSCKAISLGSFSNNFFVRHKKKKNNSILFISTGYPDGGKYLYHSNFLVCKKIDFYKSDLKALIFLNQYCLKNNIRLEFVPRFHGDRGKKEIMYYKNYLKNKKIIFHQQNEKNLVYKLSDKSFLTVSTTSTFSFESISRGNNTVVINDKKEITKNVYNPFWYFSNLEKKEKFFIEKSTFKKLNVVINMIFKRKQYTKYGFISKKTKRLLMTYNPNNTILVDEIKKILEPTKSKT